MKKLPLIVFGSMVLLASSASFAAGDAGKGKSKAAMCAACHGAAGVSANNLWPNLAGQKEGYLAKQMKAFRDGKRKDPMMSGMAKPLSDDDIANLSAYFSSLK